MHLVGGSKGHMFRNLSVLLPAGLFDPVTLTHSTNKHALCARQKPPALMELRDQFSPRWVGWWLVAPAHILMASLPKERRS